MTSLSLSLSLSTPTHCFASYNKQRYALRSPQCHHTRISHHKLQHSSSFLGYNPLRVSIDLSGGMMRKRRGGAVCYAAPLTPTNLQWVCAISSLVLMLAKGTAIHKSFLVPLFALQAPTAVVSWIQGEYGIWSAFLALIARLFFSFPGELELPFVALLMVIVAPYQVANLRGTKEGVILSLAIAAYLGFQHFTRAGSLQKAFDQGSIIATLAIICIVAMPCLLLI
ncbi:cold-regulated 413 inner membrane protein 1, chloroplastic-like [Nicotiana tabacum]|uniref:Cold-regulated 413 inner membrane protein 1, chloroplastic-like n=1 Tax=Nicotiana tabacum TaxID=4097 RepID=A0A1S3XYP8_TOBAC|nr:cold-regulated 413 inner membrane protein 1, chloroplastic-like [Nicotiana tomentosiformis]XP_016445071.1 PREDICTED: cold-regulated 413 inner membrane protein 1, chloroplastic-like [Nicotiana tabacum]